MRARLGSESPLATNFGRENPCDYFRPSFSADDGHCHCLLEKGDKRHLLEGESFPDKIEASKDNSFASLLAGSNPLLKNG